MTKFKTKNFKGFKTPLVHRDKRLFKYNFNVQRIKQKHYSFLNIITSE